MTIGITKFRAEHAITYVAPDLTIDETNACLQELARALDIDLTVWGWQDWAHYAAQGQW